LELKEAKDAEKAKLEEEAERVRLVAEEIERKRVEAEAAELEKIRV